MARQVKIKANEYGWLGASLYDQGAGRVRVPEKIIDIIDDCPHANGREKCLLVYSRNSRDSSDRTVEVSRPTRRRPLKRFKNGWHVDFGLTKYGKVTFSRRRGHCDRDTFQRSAKDLGLSEQELKHLITVHAPPF